ncbi:YfhO family protein [Staphylococcus aureus]
MPTAYNQGMKATSGDQSLKVEQVNGVMTGIKAPKNITKIQLSYVPYYYLLITITIFGIICKYYFRDGQDKNNVATHIFSGSGQK